MHREYMEEIRIQFDRVNDANDGITRRVVQIMSFIGIIMAVAAGLSMIGHTDLGPVQIVGVVGTIFMIAALVVCSMIIKIRKTPMPIISKNLINAEKLPDVESIEDAEYDDLELSDAYYAWTSSDRTNYYESMSRAYLICIHTSESVNRKISKWFNLVRGLFISGVVAYAIQVLVGYI
ncbi:MAG: hypothetical protein MPJ08_08250 [Nitrosopumilus sp.]|nr:hypothetical protein [Nitrosopumilus sp.]